MAKNELIKLINELESIQELQELQTLVENKLVKLRKQEINTARKKIQDMANELGVDIADLVPQTNKVAIKYINKKDTTQTWSGRGKRPSWLTQALANGAKLEDFEV